MRKKQPKISIIIPSYNQGIFLERCIKSVLDQKYPDLELIVIDGGSTDNSLEVIKKYETSISYWISEKDKGQANAINKGFEKANGDLLGWLNSDDYYNQYSLNLLAKYYYDHKKSNFFYGDALIVDHNDKVLHYWEANLVLDRYLRFGGLIASHSAFWIKEIHQDLDENLNCNVDGELWIRLVKNQRKKYIPYPLGSFRIQELSKSADTRWSNKWKEDDVYIEKKHGPPPSLRSFLRYEYRYLQKAFKFIIRNLVDKNGNNKQ